MNEAVCQECQLRFESKEAFQKHKAKFCINSKYGHIDSLEQQFQRIKLAPHQRILSQSSMRKITNDQEARKKLLWEHQKAMLELQNLEEQQKRILLENKKIQLGNVMHKREQLIKEEETLEKQLYQFHQKKKKHYYDQYQAGKQAGKIIQTKQLLQQKKRDIQNKLLQKKRQQQKIIQNLNAYGIQSRTQIYQYPPIKTFKLQKKAQIRQQKKITVSVQDYVSPPITKSRLNRPPSQTYTQPRALSSIESDSKHSTNSKYLHPQMFPNAPTLFQNVNSKQKNQTQILIESLLTQQYDALNILSRLPKQSPLYSIKLQQFQQMSKIRQQFKNQIHNQRIEQIQRKFIRTKEMTEQDNSNKQWLDENRKQMMHRQMEILYEHTSQDQKHMESQVQKFNKLPQLSQTFVKQNTTIQNKIKTTGYKIQLKTLANYKNGKPIKIRLIIKQDGLDQSCFVRQFQSLYHDELAPATQRDPYQPGFKNKLNKNGDIVYNEQFLVKQNLQALYNKEQREIYLFIIALEKDEAKMTDEPTTYAWYCLKITHFGTIKEGTFNVKLYGDQFTYPRPADMNRLKQRFQEEVTICLSEIALQQRPKTQIQQQTKKQGDHLMKVRFQHKKNALKNVNHNLYMPYQGSVRFQKVDFDQRISLDFGIHSLRSVPNYFAPIRMEIAFFDYSNYQLLPKAYCLSQAQSSIYDPTFKFKMEIRGQPLPPSTYILIRLLGVSTLNYEVHMIGFAVINLFYDAVGRPILDNRPQQAYLLSDNLQLHVYWGNPQQIDLKSYQKKYPTIPCMSILLGNQFVRSHQKLVLPIYSPNSYNTSLYDVTSSDLLLFEAYSKRQFQQTQLYMKGFATFKGVDSSYSSIQLKRLLEKNIQFHQQNCTNISLLNPISNYRPQIGVMFCVDSIQIESIQGKFVYFCTICKSPPALFYINKGNDYKFIKARQINQSNSEKYMFNYETVQKEPYNTNAAFIIEVYKAKVKENYSIQKPFISIGYIVRPMFDLQSTVECVDVSKGSYKLNDGAFPVEKINQLQSNLNLFLEKNKKSLKSEVTINIRCMNPSFYQQYSVNKKTKNGVPYKELFNNTKGFQKVLQNLQEILLK